MKIPKTLLYQIYTKDEAVKEMLMLICLLRSKSSIHFAYPWND